MLAVGNRPKGNRLAMPSDVRIKCLQVQRSVALTNPSDAYEHWATEWPNRLKPQIDLAVAELGPNCVKGFAGIKAVVDGRISRATHTAHVRQFVEYAASKDLLVYWCSHFFSECASMATSAATLAEVVACAEVLAEYSNVIGMDISNESIYESGNESTAAANAAAASAALHAACPELPISISLILTDYTEWGTAPYSTFAPYVDFWDFHPYYSGGDPRPGHALAFRYGSLAEYFKPFLIGECGQVAAAGESLQTSRWSSLGTFLGAPDCFGTVGYTIKDCTAADYALIAEDDTERTFMTKKFREWNGHR